MSSLPSPTRQINNSGDVSMSPNPTSQPVTTPAEKHMVHWFRKGLRMHDNPSLREGLKGCTTFRCVFILDPWFAGSSNVGINKWRFLLQCLEDLDQNLRKLNSRLFVIRGQPADILPKLFKEWKTTCLTFEEDPEPFGKVRDQNIIALCKELSIMVVSRVSHTLYDLDLIIERNAGKTPLTYQQFQSIVAKMDCPTPAEATVTPLVVRGATTPLREDHDDKYGVPTLEELGFDIEGLLPLTWKGGETEAMRRLERHLERKAWVASFARPKMTPQSLLASPTGLSPFLRFGCLSTRLFYHDLNKLYKRIKKAPPPLSLHGQLLWREFFYCAATRNPNFDRMVGNPICVQIPWDTNVEALAKWANAQTGFPWIDAIMTQLREEGWIHHLARHAVACFLTRGDLWVSWEEGMKIFDELLLDADWSVNAGMWMWLSCSSFFQQFFHCYCPVKFGRKADPNGDFIRRYLPVLKNMPTRYIHEPWIAPPSVQKASKCVVGLDYPLPMVNHPVVSKINVERMKQVYHQLASYRSPEDNNTSLFKLSSPEAMLIDFYGSSTQAPRGHPASPRLLQSHMPRAPVISTDVIQYPPCCYGDSTYTGQGSGKPVTISAMKGKHMGETPMQHSGKTTRDSPMTGNELHHSPMDQSGKSIYNSPRDDGKSNRPERPEHRDGVPIRSPGKALHNLEMSGKPFHCSTLPTKSMSQQTLMLPPATIDDQISGDYMRTNQSKFSQIFSNYSDAISVSTSSSMSLSDSRNPVSTMHPPAAQGSSYPMVQSAGECKFSAAEPAGDTVYAMSQSERDSKDAMLNEESNVIDIADSIISESEERQKLEQ